jgi:hypothetical protein
MKKGVNLWNNTGFLSFINPLHVEVASIGTVLRTAVFFLCPSKISDFFKFRKVIATKTKYSSSSFGIEVDYFNELIFGSIKKSSLPINQVSFKPTQQIVNDAQLGIVNVVHDSEFKGIFTHNFGGLSYGFVQRFCQFFGGVTLPSAEVNMIVSLLGKTKIDKQFVQNVKVKLSGITIVLVVENQGILSANGHEALNIRKLNQELKEFFSYFGVVLGGMKKPIRLLTTVFRVVQRIRKDFFLKSENVISKFSSIFYQNHTQHQNRFEVFGTPKRSSPFSIKIRVSRLINE